MSRRFELTNKAKRRSVVLEEFTLPEYMQDPKALDFIDFTACGLTEKQLNAAATMPAEELDANDDEDGEPFSEDDAIASGE